VGTPNEENYEEQKMGDIGNVEMGDIRTSMASL
jgi:hypothetical protein